MRVGVCGWVGVCVCVVCKTIKILPVLKVVTWSCDWHDVTVQICLLEHIISNIGLVSSDVGGEGVVKYCLVWVYFRF